MTTKRGFSPFSRYSLAQPPCVELLAIAAFEKRERDRRAARAVIEQQKQQIALKKKNRKGGLYTRTKGIGIYYDPIVVAETDPKLAEQARIDEKLKCEERERVARVEQIFVDNLVGEYSDLYVGYQRQIVKFGEYILANFDAAHDRAAGKIQAKDLNDKFDVFEMTLESGAKYFLVGYNWAMRQPGAHATMSTWHLIHQRQDLGT